MSLSAFGFLIDDAIFCFDNPLKVVNVSGHLLGANPIFLRSTMSNLLFFLLMQHQKEIITDNEIMHHVWDKNGLSSSHSRLVQVISALKQNIVLAGVRENMIERVSGKGYRITSENIKILYQS
ncbi:transcriptional regulator [Klebsiella oxytoca]|uniref:Transcriptional regulator n=1 Tax=Klebsiella oxytoca TaxID=571 RepID=A0A318G6J6_KLEOX|nr:helix-turn-helix domain-containing protein [Klebsiella oxytoca]PXW48749.1 transcriptional regulator [Klebsiella oxytoca]HCB1497585.1 helix-turn-helix domain-containing protein [Klebsiella michiganensis]HCB1844782.1 helix-turn-helix domain-containing protein [Klebsiella oxytoca]